MKTKILLALMMMLPLVACSQSRLLNAFPNGDGVSKVYVGPAMMKMGMSQIQGASGPFSNSVKDVKGVEVYSCENSKLTPQVIADFEALLGALDVEEVVYSEDGGDVSRIYIYTEKGASEPSGMIIFNSDSGKEVSIVVVHGKIDSMAGVNE